MGETIFTFILCVVAFWLIYSITRSDRFGSIRDLLLWDIRQRRHDLSEFCKTVVSIVKRSLIWIRKSGFVGRISRLLKKQETKTDKDKEKKNKGPRAL